jgi:hypothetical protein
LFPQGCGSGSGLDPDSETFWIRIRIGNPDPDPGARKLRNFSGKNALFSYPVFFFYKNFTTNKVKNSINYFLKKFLMNNSGIFYLI